MVSNSFDYVIVGAGSAGCVLANRLSAAPDVRVLLVEAGGSDERFLIKMPLGFLRAVWNPALTWGYMSEPEPTLDGRSLWLPRGKVLGGSSSINGMFFMRGHSSDFDAWAAMGCAGWSFAEVLPYFRRLENSWRGAGRWHGGDGPLRVTAIDTRRLLHEPLMRSAAAAGFAICDDLHGECEEGFARGEITVDARGRRASTSRAYLYPVLRRANVELAMGALVTRVCVENGTATGIEYRQGGRLIAVRAAREVILCGGAFNSPQLLMLSGIGPADELRAHGIAVQTDLAGVGRNLSEHARVPIEFATRGDISFLNELRADRIARSVLQWVFTGTGACATQINSCNIVVRSDPKLARPDIQLMSNPVRMDAKVWWPLLGPRQEHRVTADAVVLHPESRGRVTLRSADPNDKPRIRLNALATDADLATARRGVRLARRIYATPPQSALIAHECSPGADIESDSALNAYIRARAGVTQHPVGTCAMGVGADAVLDPQLKVRGIAGLRVADASVMPTVPGGNTNGAVVMIGEKAADLILGRTLPPDPPRPGAQPQ
ncbi:MAG TPA: GMC family oxidoreductase N-terminal domain-containing protein [Steroidobacteraceae bacterium]|nr:GMC family oxidoreductase N-terminal domain-containing protein [Steroidobacteraceae bacterium]